jgi:hypothetical protein
VVQWHHGVIVVGYGMAIVTVSVGLWWAFVAIGVGLWWAFTTPARACRSSGAGDMAQRRCIVEAVGSGG